MSYIIHVSHLSRSFRQYKKSAGLKASIKGIFHREYFNINAVDDVSFDIAPGEMVGFIGPNGAGKTTTLKMLSGLLHKSSGEINVLGFEPFKRQPEFLKSYALVMGQKSQLLWDLPPIETFELNKEIYSIDPKKYHESINYLSELLGVTEVLEVPVRKLSLGQRMKCELIASLLHQPQLLFLDEPTIGLDVVVQKKIRAFLKEYNQLHQTTVMLTSHYMEDVQELCSRVIIINQGKVVYDGDLASLIRRYANYKNLKLDFTKKVKKDDLIKFGEITHFHDGLSATIKVPRDTHLAVASALIKKLPVDNLDIAEIGLDEVIRQIFTQ